MRVQVGFAVGKLRLKRSIEYDSPISSSQVPRGMRESHFENRIFSRWKSLLMIPLREVNVGLRLYAMSFTQVSLAGLAFLGPWHFLDVPIRVYVQMRVVPRGRSDWPLLESV